MDKIRSALRIAKKRAKGGAVSDLYGENYKPELGSDSEGDVTTADILARTKARDAGFPGALRDVARAIPHVEAEDTSTASGILSRLGRTATEMPRSSLNTVANWFGQTPEIGPDTLAPLGLAPMGMALTPRNAIGSAGGKLASSLPMDEASRLNKSGVDAAGPRDTAAAAALPELREYQGIRALHAGAADFDKFDSAFAGKTPQGGGTSYPGSFSFSQNPNISGPEGSWGGAIKASGGKPHFYEVDINVDQRMVPVLNLPLEKQTPEVQAILRDNIDKLWASPNAPNVHTLKFNGELFDQNNPIHFASARLATIRDRDLAIRYLKEDASKAVTRSVRKKFEAAAKVLERGEELTPDRLPSGVPIGDYAARDLHSLFDVISHGRYPDGRHEDISVTNTDLIRILKKDGKLLSRNDTVSVPGTVINSLAQPNEGIRGYHGSPHDFDKIDVSRRRSSTQAQAFGPGFYITENKSVGGRWRDEHSTPSGSPRFMVGDEPLVRPSDHNGRVAYDWVSSANGNVDAAIAKASRDFNDDRRPEVLRILNGWKERGVSTTGSRLGHLYEVNFNADPNHLLDWNKSLAQQSAQVRSALSKVGVGSDHELAALRSSLVSAKDAQPLLDAGIKGVRFWDDADAGGTGYVVFSGGDAQIVAKNGNPILSDTTRSSVPGTVVNALEERASGGSVGPNMHNPKIASALRIAGKFADGGVPELKSYEPTLEDKARWTLQDIGVPGEMAGRAAAVVPYFQSAAKALSPPIPGYNYPSLSEGTEALRAKVADKSHGEITREGLGEFSGEAIPMVATAAFPVARSALRAVGQGLARAPLTTGTAAAGLGMTALPGEAGEKSNLQKLYEQKAILEQRRQAAELEAEKERRTGKGPNYQAALGRVSQVNVEMSAVNQQIAEEQKLNSPEFQLEMEQKRIDAERAQKAKDANTPIKELYPKLTAAIPYATWLASMGLGALAKGRHVSNFNKEMTDLSSRWAKALETARSGSAAAPKAVTEAEGLGRQFEAMKAAGPSSKGTILPGAALGEFGQLAPVGIDYARAQPGSDLYKKTVDTMTSPQEVAGRIVTGAMSGAIPAKIGSKLADRPKFVPGYSAETTAAREAMPRGYQPPPSNTQSQSQSSTRSTAESSPFPSRTQAEPSGSKSQTIQEPATDPVQSTSAASSSVPPMRRKDKNGRVYYHDRLTGHRTSKPDKNASNKTPAEEDPPFAHGGIVRSALRIARKFGGRIGKSAGLLKSDVPGRTDHIETSVKSGSFVLPADVVSHVGQNNTESGGKWLDERFKTGPYGTAMGKSSAGPKAQKALSIAKSKFASGGSVDVPILAAGGEYIISPEKVAEIGGGDLDRGHAILDKFVLDVRNDHIATLQNLPAPQKD